MLETSIKELECKCLISWKWGCKGDVLLQFVKEPCVIWRFRTSQKALEKCQLDHHFLLEEKEENQCMMCHSCPFIKTKWHVVY